jgi:hypothetical protein
MTFASHKAGVLVGAGFVALAEASELAVPRA